MNKFRLLFDFFLFHAKKGGFFHVKKEKPTYFLQIYILFSIFIILSHFSKTSFKSRFRTPYCPQFPLAAAQTFRTT